MRNTLLSLALILPILLSSCSSGKKAYEQGDYYSAVLKSVNRLRKNPKHKKSKEALRNSYPLALQTLEQNANTALTTNQQYKFKLALQSYEAINRLYREIQASPGARKVIHKPKNYFDKVAELKQKAAEESYAIGLELLSHNTREDAKQAFFNFQDANNFVPDYKEVREKMAEAKFIATLKVIVEQIPVPTLYSLSANFFQDKIEEYLHTQYHSNQFVRFYTQQEADAEELQYVDQYLRLQFDDFTVGETHIERNTETVTRDSVVVGTATLDDGSKVYVYNTVSAKITINRKEVISRGLFSMRVFDSNSNAVLTHRKFTGEFVWFSQWGSFNGDERALTDEELKICEASEVPPPQPQFLFIEFTKPIYSQLTNAVNGFYRNY